MKNFPETPQTLLTRLMSRASGETEAEWFRFFDLYKPVIEAFAEMCGSPTAEKEDVAQEVFAKLVEMFRTGGYDAARGKFRSYLAAMIKNEVINRWHKREVRGEGRRVALDDCEMSAALRTPAVAGVLHDVQWRIACHRSAVEHVLTRTGLSEKYRAVYRAYVLNEEPIAAVAERFGLTRNEVSQIKRRVGRMVEAYARMYEE